MKLVALKVCFHVARGAAYATSLILIWYLCVIAFEVPEFVLPSPYHVGKSLLELPNFYLWHSMVTLSEAALGLFFGLCLGFFCGVLLRYGGRVGALLSPIMVVSQVFPKEAIAPLIIVFLGFGLAPKILIATVICFFPAAINTAKGLSTAVQGQREFLMSLGARSWQLFLYCDLPSSARYVFAAMRLCSTLCIVGAVVGEFIGGSNGLGHIIRASTSDLGTERAFAALLLLGVIGGILYGLVLGTEWVLAKYTRAF